MDEPSDHAPDPSGAPLGGAWDDVPLLREIERVLRSSSGPVNWELARQIGIASATQGGPDPEPTEEDHRLVDEAVRVAELRVADLTGLEPPHDVAVVTPVRRARWVQENLQGLRTLLEPSATKLGAAVASAQQAAMPEEASAVAGQMLQQLAPLLSGAQVGSVLGYLGQHVLGQYDVAVPRPGGASTLLFVVPNLARFERDWSLPPVEFRTFVAIHEVTHRFEFSKPWAGPRFRELLDDFLSTLELDVESLQRRFATLDPSNPEAIQELLGGEEALFGAVLDDEQRLKLGRIQSFMAAAEGYGDHVMHAIGRSLLSSYARIEEAMRRYREGEHADPVFERLLGIEMKREQYEMGKAFCDTVVELTDERTLARMWDVPEAMPSLPELQEPRLWLARTV